MIMMKKDFTIQKNMSLISNREVKLFQFFQTKK